MASSWSGFLPQNDTVKLHWGVLEACQTEIYARALGIYIGKNLPEPPTPADDSREEDAWTFENLLDKPVKPG